MLLMLWNQISAMFKYRWRSRKPCLLLAENTKENPNCLRKILNASNNKCYQLKLPETFGARCWGSVCGWIVTLDLDRQLHIFNPFTKARICLPPQPTMPHVFLPLEEFDEYATRNIFITKSIVLKDVQGEQDDFVVLAIVGSWKRMLAFARPGEQAWTSIDSPWTLTHPLSQMLNIPLRHRVADIACCGARAIILYVDGSLGYLDISDISVSKQPVKAKIYLQGPPKGLLQKYFDPPNQLGIYLVESFGELLMVLRRKGDIYEANGPGIYDEDRSYGTTGFEVYRLKLGPNEWELLNKLGDVALYIGVSHSISVRASGTGSCKSDCIYFTDDFAERWESTEFGGHDMGVFDMGSKKIEKFYNGDDLYSKFCPPMWFMPQFFVD